MLSSANADVLVGNFLLDFPGLPGTLLGGLVRPISLFLLILLVLVSFIAVLVLVFIVAVVGRISAPFGTHSSGHVAATALLCVKLTLFAGEWYAYHSFCLSSSSVGSQSVWNWLFDVAMLMTLWCFLRTALTDPGTPVSPEWQAWRQPWHGDAAKFAPPVEDRPWEQCLIGGRALATSSCVFGAEQNPVESLQVGQDKEGRLEILPMSKDTKRWPLAGQVTTCVLCDVLRPERAHHCRSCGVCVLRMDHHCPMVGNCIGWRNHKYFVLFVAQACVACAWTVIIFMRGLLTPPSTFVRRAQQNAAVASSSGAGDLVLRLLPLGLTLSVETLHNNLGVQLLCIITCVLCFLLTIFTCVMVYDQWEYMGEGLGVIDRKQRGFEPGQKERGAIARAEVGLCRWCGLDNLPHIMGGPLGWRWLVPSAPKGRSVAALSEDELITSARARYNNRTGDGVDAPDKLSDLDIQKDSIVTSELRHRATGTADDPPSGEVFSSGNGFPIWADQPKKDANGWSDSSGTDSESSGGWM